MPTVPVFADEPEPTLKWYYIHDEASWNAAYNVVNWPLQKYYALNPDEDRWCDADGEGGNQGHYGQAVDKNEWKWPDYCVHSWQWAVNATNAKYPWAAVDLPATFNGTISFEYNGGDAIYPWGKHITRTQWYGMASIPEEFNHMAWKVDVNGDSTEKFDPSLLEVKIIPETLDYLTENEDWFYIYNESTWNAAYDAEHPDDDLEDNSTFAKTPLHRYLDRNPDEDRWCDDGVNPAHYGQAIDKVDWEWPKYCVQSWQWAINASDARYPRIVLWDNSTTPGRHYWPLVFKYKDSDKGINEYKEDAAESWWRLYWARSIPDDREGKDGLGWTQFLLDDGVTSFDKSKLTVLLVTAQDTPITLEKADESTPVVEYEAQIWSQWYATVAEAIAAAQNNDTVEILKAWTYILPNIPLNITIKWNVDGVVFEHNANDSYNIANIPNWATFEDVKFSLIEPTVSWKNPYYHGFGYWKIDSTTSKHNSAPIVMNNCVIEWELTTYWDMQFNWCTFNIPENEKYWNVWTWFWDITFDDCTFNWYDRNIHVHNTDWSKRWNIIVKDSKFSKRVSSAKSALVIKESHGTPNGTDWRSLQYNVTITNPTLNTATNYTAQYLWNKYYMIDYQVDGWDENWSYVVHEDPTTMWRWTVEWWNLVVKLGLGQAEATEVYRTPKIIAQNCEWEAKIWEVCKDTLVKAIQDAEDGATITVLKNIANVSNLDLDKNLTIVAATAWVTLTAAGNNSNGNTILWTLAQGKTVTFDWIMFDLTNVKYSNAWYSAWFNLASSAWGNVWAAANIWKVAFNNCIFNWRLTVVWEATFAGCTFNYDPTEAYQVEVRSRDSVSFSNCTFNWDDRNINIYDPTHSALSSSSSKISFSSCTFNAPHAVKKWAIVIHEQRDGSTLDKFNVEVTSATVAEWTTYPATAHTEEPRAIMHSNGLIMIDDYNTAVGTQWRDVVVTVDNVEVYATPTTKYTVTWDNGTQTPEIDENVEYGATPEYNGAEPTKAADAQYTYAFAWWKVEGAEDNTAVAVNQLPTVSENTTYVAVFTETAREYTIKFDNQWHWTAPTDITNVEYGAKITEPSALTENWWTFGWWYKEATCENIWNFESDTVSADTVLYAKWTGKDVIITVDWENDGQAHHYGDIYTLPTNHIQKPNDTATVTFKYNDNITAVTTSTVTKTYTPNGWTIGETHYANEAKITLTDNVTLVPDYTEEVTAAVLPTPTRDHYDFDGWYNGQTKYESYNTVADIELTAKWIGEAVTLNGEAWHNYWEEYALWTNNGTKEPTEHATVTFIYDNGAGNTTSKVTKTYTPNGWLVNWVHKENGETITLEWNTTIEPNYTPTTVSATFPNPEKEHYTFNGWYNGEIKYTNYTGDNDIELTAKWTGDPITITDDTPDWLEHRYGDTYTLPEVPTKDSESRTVTFKYDDGITADGSATVTKTYTPAGWKVNEQIYQGSSIELTGDITLTPNYTESITPAVFPQNPTREHYTFSGWFNGETKYTEYNTFDDIILTAKWDIDTFTVTWMNGETQLQKDENVARWSTPTFNWTAAPTKPETSSYTYSFKWWSRDNKTIVDLTSEQITENTTYYALFTETAKQTSNWWWGGGWWGGGSSSSYSCKNLPSNATANNTDKPKANTNYSYSTDTKAVCTFQCNSGFTWNATNSKCEKSETQATTWDTALTNTWNTTTLDNSLVQENEWSTSTDSNSQEILENGFTKEFNNAYEFAFRNGITTMPDIQNAHMYGELNRIAMAKMLSNYGMNILWKKPANVVVPEFTDVSSELNEQYGNAVTLAYQLGIMWINMPNNEFRPFDTVTRAEFGTALSRLLFGLADWSDAYYTTHLAKLKAEWIITNDDPTLQELRWYIMIMLMRAAK